MTLEQWLEKEGRSVFCSFAPSGVKDSKQVWHKVVLFQKGIKLGIGIGPTKEAAKADAMASLPAKYR